ncbi:hypothetical protein AB0P05_26445 [Streptomyces flaveolus]|uniref:hypothetical protein n=1 Tax=Streptomyces flaveolus TaxID=67297 RepID=UPI0034452D8E
MSGHGYTWSDVRKASATELKVGDTWVAPGAGTAYFEARDGRVRGAGLVHAMPLDGIAWTVMALDRGVVTARSHDGRERTEAIPADARLLFVQR